VRATHYYTPFDVTNASFVGLQPQALELKVKVALQLLQYPVLSAQVVQLVGQLTQLEVESKY
jgi:hypothetical protein